MVHNSTDTQQSALFYFYIPGTCCIYKCTQTFLSWRKFSLLHFQITVIYVSFKHANSLPIYSLTKYQIIWLELRCKKLISTHPANCKYIRYNFLSWPDMYSYIQKDVRPSPTHGFLNTFRIWLQMLLSIMLTSKLNRIYSQIWWCFNNSWKLHCVSRYCE